MNETDSKRKIRVLLVEDSEEDAQLALRQLGLAGFETEWRRVDTQRDYLTHLDSSIDVVLSDYHMPQFDALKALRLLQETGMDIPFLIVSGTIGDERAVAAIKSGADDYLLKDRMARLGSAVTQALDKKRLREERRKVEGAWRSAEDKFRRLVEHSLVGIYVIQDGKYAYANPKMAEMFGCSTEELLARPMAEFVHEEDRAVMAENVRKRLAGEVESIHYSLRALRKDGSIIYVEAHGGRMEFNGRPAILGTLLDVTQQRSLEEQLRHSQKMEAIGLLAGGVAHDFNNILTVIRGYTQMLLKEEPPESGRREPLGEILGAAERASRLTSQLLTFGRKQMRQLKTLDLHQVINEVAKMLQRVIGEDIKLQVDCAPERLFVHADSGMLEQVLMNLSVNARDAMPLGGRLSIMTRREVVESSFARLHPQAYPGEFVLLRVSDTGCGIPSEVMGRMFEPFFTTKAPGKGTGLGLATVHSIAQQHRGWVEVESVVGRGTTFSVYLPAVGEPAAAPSAPPPPPPRAQGGTETILVVEDEPGIRRLVATVLRRRAYRVLEAGSGAEALALWEKHGAETDMVITDMIMPNGMTGAELVDGLCELKPRLKVVFTSGYCAEEIRAGRRLEEGVNFLQKPYLPEQLAKIVRQCLDS